MVFRLPRFEKCCCCVPLRIGSLIIGYISIVISVLILAMVSWSIYKVATFIDDNKSSPPPGHRPDDMAKAALGLYISFACYLLVFLYSLVISVLLVFGVHTDKPRYLRIYFNGALVLFAMSVALVVITCIFMGILATLTVLKWCFTIFGCLIIVRSTYLQMEEVEKPRIYEMQPFNSSDAPLVA